MADIINWETLFICPVCNETYVSVPKPKIDIEKFIEGEPCSGCGHKQLNWK